MHTLCGIGGLYLTQFTFTCQEFGAVVSSTFRFSKTTFWVPCQVHACFQVPIAQARLEETLIGTLLLSIYDEIRCKSIFCLIHLGLSELKWSLLTIMSLLAFCAAILCLSSGSMVILVRYTTSISRVPIGVCSSPTFTALCLSPVSRGSIVN